MMVLQSSRVVYRLADGQYTLVKVTTTGRIALRKALLILSCIVVESRINCPYRCAQHKA